MLVDISSIEIFIYKYFLHFRDICINLIPHKKSRIFNNNGRYINT